MGGLGEGNRWSKMAKAASEVLLKETQRKMLKDLDQLGWRKMMQTTRVLIDAQPQSKILIISKISTPAVNMFNGLIRHDICPKFYSAGFPGQIFYTTKVHNLRHFFSQINNVNASNINNLGIFLL